MGGSVQIWEAGASANTGFHLASGRLGFSKLDQKKVDEPNILSDFSAEALKAVAVAGRLALLEFPEDLGRAPRGTPSSLWQWQSFKEPGGLGLSRGALCQDECADVRFLKPTGLLTNIKQILGDPKRFIGWPQFDEQGYYAGPLPRRRISWAYRQRRQRKCAEPKTGLLDIGLQQGRSDVPKVADIECGTRPLMPLVNTVLSLGLNCKNSRVNWTSVRLVFISSQSGVTGSRWLGSAVAWKPSGEGRAVFYQGRGVGGSFSAELSNCPLFFDPSRPFAIASGDNKAVAASAYQHELKPELNQKSLNRLKAMDCSIDDPLGWFGPDFWSSSWQGFRMAAYSTSAVARRASGCQHQSGPLGSRKQ